MIGQTCCALLIRNVGTNHVLWLIVANQDIYDLKQEKQKFKWLKQELMTASKLTSLELTI
jgi:hypothetical protein